MKTLLTFLLLLVLSFLKDYQVTGRCGGERDKIANTNWAACLVAENNVENGNCPHGFPKLNVPSCGRHGSSRTRPYPYKNLVCCALSPIFDLKIKQSPCVAGRQSNDKSQKKSHSH